MPTRRLALILPNSNVVREIIATDRADFGNPGNVWHDVTDQPKVAAGWIFKDGKYAAPPAPSAPPPAAQSPPDLASLRAQLDALAAQLAALERKP